MSEYVFYPRSRGRIFEPPPRFLESFPPPTRAREINGENSQFVWIDELLSDDALAVAKCAWERALARADRVSTSEWGTLLGFGPSVAELLDALEPSPQSLALARACAFADRPASHEMGAAAFLPAPCD